MARDASAIKNESMSMHLDFGVGRDFVGGSRRLGVSFQTCYENIWLLVLKFDTYGSYDNISTILGI